MEGIGRRGDFYTPNWFEKSDRSKSPQIQTSRLARRRPWLRCFRSVVREPAAGCLEPFSLPVWRPLSDTRLFAFWRSLAADRFTAPDPAEFRVPPLRVALRCCAAWLV